MAYPLIRCMCLRLVVLPQEAERLQSALTEAEQGAMSLRETLDAFEAALRAANERAEVCGADLCSAKHLVATLRAQRDVAEADLAAAKRRMVASWSAVPSPLRKVHSY
jgi:hypothetical protein